MTPPCIGRGKRGPCRATAEHGYRTCPAHRGQENPEDAHRARYTTDGTPDGTIDMGRTTYDDLMAFLYGSIHRARQDRHAMLGS